MAKLTSATRGSPGGPVLLVIHGMAQDEQRALRWSEQLDPDGDFHTVAPRAPSPVSGGYTWFPTWGERTTRVAIKQLERLVLATCEEHGSDPSASVVLGFSEGGAAVAGLAYAADSRVRPAAVITIGGFAPRHLPLEAAAPVPPALVIHADDDTMVDPSQADHLAATLTTLGADVTRASVEGGHRVSPEALFRASAWLDATTASLP